MVSDLCSSLHRSDPSLRFDCYLDDTGRNLRDINLTSQSLEQHDSGGDAQLVNLEELLPLRSRSVPRGLTTKQRVLLAVILASSLLQLHSTAWLEQGWSKRGVSFLRNLRQPLSQSVDVKRPLLLHRFPKETPGGSRTRETNKGAMGESKIALLSLGVLLLELYLGEALESHFPDEASVFTGLDNSWKTLALAKDWLDEETENLSAARQSAISFCLENIVGIKTDLDEPTFRKTVHDELVAPLQEAKDFFGPNVQLG